MDLNSAARVWGRSILSRPAAGPVAGLWYAASTGHRVAVPMVPVHTIGAGVGSIVSVDGRAACCKWGSIARGRRRSQLPSDRCHDFCEICARSLEWTERETVEAHYWNLRRATEEVLRGGCSAGSN